MMGLNFFLAWPPKMTKYPQPLKLLDPVETHEENDLFDLKLIALKLLRYQIIILWEQKYLIHEAANVHAAEFWGKKKLGDFKSIFNTPAMWASLPLNWIY